VDRQRKTPQPLRKSKAQQLIESFLFSYIHSTPNFHFRSILLFPKGLASSSHSAVIRVYDTAGNVIETHEHKGDFREP
jgi:hypothetical protein